MASCRQSQRVKTRGTSKRLSMSRLSLSLSIASLLFGVIVYVGSVSGAFWAKATPLGDHGVIPTAAVFVLFGLLGLLLGRGKPADVAPY
jgi:hypothetical protein